MVTSDKVRVIRFFSRALVGLPEYYGIDFGVKLFEDLLDNHRFTPYEPDLS